MLEVQLRHLQSDVRSWDTTSRGSQPRPASAWADLKDQGLPGTALGRFGCYQPFLLLHSEPSDVTSVPVHLPVKDAL